MNDSHAARLQELPRVGWITAPSPIAQSERLGHELGLDVLTLKRDDLIPALGGGSKVRKLDVLLATTSFRNASGWLAIGSIGSGQLVALAAAAAQLDANLQAHCFWTEPTQAVLQNLAVLAGSPVELRYHRSRLALVAAEPRLFFSKEVNELAVVPPGATSTEAMLGFVLAGLELAAQIREQGLKPDRIYLPLGSAGSAVGLGVGLRLAGVEIMIVAVAVAEAVLCSRARLARLRGSVTRWLGVDPGCSVPVVIERRFLGPGYGATTLASLAACATAHEHGLVLDPAYGAKAMAALVADARAGLTKTPLFWHTGHGPLPAPRSHWRVRLPPELSRALFGAKPREPQRGFARRSFLVATAAVLAGTGLTFRVIGTEPLRAWTGVALSAREARTVMAAAQVLVPRAFDHLALQVDAYIHYLPASAQREVHAMLAMVEHGAPLAAGSGRRFSDAEAEDRMLALTRLLARGGVAAQIVRGLRDLCLLAYYAEPSAWPALGYDGPWVRGQTTEQNDYRRLRAERGAEPLGARHDL